jgi:hypothetical protein
MLKPIDAKQIPYISADPEQIFVRYTHLYPFKQHSPYEIINLNNTIQVVVAILMSQDNPEFPVKISLPANLSKIEILSLSTLQMLPSIFKDCRFIQSDKNIIAVQVKGLKEEAIESFLKLKKQNKIDQCLITLLRNNEQREMGISTVKAFEILDNEKEIIISDNINQLLSNKFFMYLIIESIRCGGIFGLPFPGWKKNEIEKQGYFKELTKVFNKVFILGLGEDWESTHLIVAEPTKKILDLVIE